MATTTKSPAPSRQDRGLVLVFCSTSETPGPEKALIAKMERLLRTRPGASPFPERLVDGLLR